MGRCAGPRCPSRESRRRPRSTKGTSRGSTRWCRSRGSCRAADPRRYVHIRVCEKLEYDLDGFNSIRAKNACRLTSKRGTSRRLAGEEKCHRVSGVEDGGVLFAHAVKMAGQTYSKRAVRPANYRPRCRSYLCPVNQLENRVSPVTLLSRGRDQTLPRVEYTVERIRTGSRRMHVGVPPPRLLKLVRTSERILLMWFDLVSLRGVLWWCNGRHARGTGEISAARGVEGDQNTDCSWRRRLKRKEKRGPPRPARRTH